MNTSIKNVLAAVFAIFVLAYTANASAAKPENNLNGKTISSIKNVRHLVVSGNVTVFLLQAETESVKLCGRTDVKQVTVRQDGDVLKVSASQNQPVTLAIYVRNLSTIEAAGNASISTSGKISFLGLDVLLKDHAKADIQASIVSLYTSLKDDASLTLSGSAQEHTSVLGAFARLDMNRFTAANTSIISQPVTLISGVRY